MLDLKIRESIKLIQRGEKLALALNPDDGYFVGFSGGKDSQVLLDLVKRSGVRHRAYYSVTTNDPPENVYFIRNNYPEVKLLHPHLNFFELIQKKGLPTMSHRWCCEILKEGAGAGNVVLTGVRREESNKRAKYPTIDVRSNRLEHQRRTRPYTLEEFENNKHQCIKVKDKIVLYPLLEWTTTEIWYYIAANKLPLNSCYKTSGRVGCMFCPYSSIDELKHYKDTYPKFYELLRKSLAIYLSKSKDNKRFQTPEEYIAWWESKQPISAYIAKNSHKQTEIQFQS